MPQEKYIKNKYRYPGVTPFTTEQSDIFFGRNEDIKELTRLVNREKLVVLYGKSGLGKSSLLNAGLIPELKEKTNFSPLIIRFGAWREGESVSPLDITKQIVAQNFIDGTFLDSLILQENSLWYYLKRRHINERKKNILIFDQFEELFSYPREEILEFQQELSELLNTSIPLRFLRIMDEKEILSEKHEEELEVDSDVRVLFTIRSDRMHMMDRLKKYLPTILKYNYELKALKKEDACDAIVMPAQSLGNFKTEPFIFTSEAIENLLIYLQNENDKEGRIEGILLQMLCEYYERNLIEERSLQILTNENIGDPEQVVKKYYNEKINGLNKVDRISAKTLIEEGLISEGETMRLTLHESFIKGKYNVSDELLGKLIELRLLRSEPFIRGGYTYELSHDRLIGPVVNARNKSRQEQAFIEIEEQRKALIEAKKRTEEEAILRQKAENGAKIARKQTRFANFISIVAVMCALFGAWSYEKANRATELARKNEMLAKDALEEVKTETLKKEKSEFSFVLENIEGLLIENRIPSDKMKEQLIKNKSKFETIDLEMHNRIQQAINKITKLKNK